MKKPLIVFLFILKFYALLSQEYTVKGKVTEEQGTALEFANIVLLHKTDSSYVTGTISKTNGNFLIKCEKGSYLLQFSMIGYQTSFKEIGVDKDIDLKNILLKPSLTSLDQVIIKEKKNILTRKMDRIVFDAGAIAQSSGSVNALEVLEKVPGLIVNENEVKVIGKGSIKVLIDGREIKLGGKGLINMLRTYQATELSKVEVFTTPPAKYDAEGDAGVLNIKLKKSRKNYLEANITGSYSLAKNNNKAGFAGISVNYKLDKLKAFINVNKSFGSMGYEERNWKYFPKNTWHSQSNRKYDFLKYDDIRAGLAYEFENGWTIGAEGYYNRSQPDISDRNMTNIISANKSTADSVIHSTSQKQDKTDSKLLNIYAIKKIDKLGKKLKFSGDYINYSSNTQEEFMSHTSDRNNNPLPKRDFGFNNDTKQSIKAFTSSIDLDLPYTKHTISFGAKLSLVETNNKLAYYKHKLLQDQNDDFSYQENIYALYSDFSKKFNGKWSMRTGLRLEHTQTEGISEKTKTKAEKNYTRLFPTFYLGYTPSKNHSLSLSFSSRISRPSFNMVNPFRFYFNEYNVVYGQANLKPGYIYNINLGHTFKRNLNFGLYYSYKEGEIGQVTNMNSKTHVSENFWDNFLTKHNYGITNSYLIKGFPLFQSYLRHGAYYSKSISNSIYTPKEETGFSYYASLNNTLYLNKAKTFRGNVRASYNSKTYSANSTVQPSYNINLGVTYYLLDGDLILNAYCNNLLHTNHKGTSISNNLQMEFDNIYSYTSLMFSVSYRIGTNILRPLSNTSSDEIKRRM